MSREIKFRAWSNNENMVPWEDLKEDRLPVDSLAFVTLMQYTGLKDKNGVEIYEGDIVRHGVEDALEIVRFGHADITSGLRGRKFDYVGFYLQMTDSDSVEHWGISYTVEHGEVIGNIYENPELLKDVG